MIVGKLFDSYNLIGIEGEKEGIKNLGNGGFGFSEDEIEIVNKV